ncbi:Histone-lysine N-methyltransferase SETMAR [Eumeta japonica]|uniref:Histone-lysine N-methyltransferase SETMAR n=1 Tax=Eumeta variegata TaxID=151549 RepID=A0A4C1YJ26_EUMVA|nr:Histone-lysine N-methyltransferase SETMAR [Eumeta japonica]
MNRVLTCNSLLKRNETEPFLKILITVDENSITYVKNVRKNHSQKARSSTDYNKRKPGLTGNKLMLCVLWDWKGIMMSFYRREKLSDFYYQKLMKLKQKVEAEEKRPKLINRKGVVFQHDNARPYTSLATQHILKSFV